MDLDKLSDERIRALANPFFPDGTPNPFQVLDPGAAERYIASRHEDGEAVEAVEPVDGEGSDLD